MRPDRDRRPLFISALFVLLLLAGLGSWPSIRTALCPSILIASSHEKADLLQDLANSYSSGNVRTWFGCRPSVRVDRVASGDAERLLAAGWAGERRPDVWSPAASTWVDLLRQHLADAARPSPVPDGQPPAIATSPLVVAMPEPMARAMGWPVTQPGWRELLLLADDSRGWGRFGHPEWGAFRLGKTDPGKSTSGIHSLIAAYYAATGKSSDLTAGDLQAPATRAFVAGVEASVSHYAPTVGSFLDNLAASDSLSYISALAVEEQEVFHYNEGGHSEARPALPPRIPLAAIYPAGGTLLADHPYVVLRWASANEAKRRIATEFLQWLQEPSQQSRFSAEGFRDYRRVASGRLAGEVGILSGQPALLLQPPAPAIIAAIQKSWREFRKRARILILLALTTASQRAEVRAGVEALSASDEVALWSLAPGRTLSTMGVTPLATGLDPLRAAIGSAPIGSGLVPLYGTIEAAHRFLKLNSDRARITGVVVIVANRDDGSGPMLSTLQREVRPEPGGSPIPIYAVALGGSDQDALRGIEKASGGVLSSSRNAPEAIRTSLANF